jgi:hypothetical protein
MVEIYVLLAPVGDPAESSPGVPRTVTYPVPQPRDLLDLELRLVMNVYQHPLALFEFLHDTVVLCDQIYMLLNGILVGAEISMTPSLGALQPYMFYLVLQGHLSPLDLGQ